jgi:hypothetical protein
MLPTLLVILPLAALYWFPIRRWMNQWGANSSDLARVMAGDTLLPNETYSGTTAVTVNARPEHIWPWLVQIGYQRGGLYSYDWLDRLFGYLDRPSATRILPEFQHLAVGDTIPLGRGPSWPVAVVEPNRVIVGPICRRVRTLQRDATHLISAVSAAVRARDGDHVSRQCEAPEKNRPNFEHIRERSGDRLSGLALKDVRAPEFWPDIEDVLLEHRGTI